MAITVTKGGLETTVQDYPGRKGAFGMGFPPSGPIDHWSFRLANVLVGNAPGAAALECAFIGPTLCFERDSVIALTGADMKATLDGEPVPLWQSIGARAGQTLALGSAITGARTYIAFAGGIDVPLFLDSPCDLRHRRLRRPRRRRAEGRADHPARSLQRRRTRPPAKRGCAPPWPRRRRLGDRGGGRSQRRLDRRSRPTALS